MGSNRDVMFEIDLNRAVITFYQSGPWADYFGYHAGEEYPYESALGAIVDAYFDRDDKEAFLHTASLDAIRAAFRRQVPLISTDVRIKTPGNGLYEWYRVTAIAPIFGKCRCTIQNIHKEKEAELQLRQQAERDSLTNLLNRSTFDRMVNDRFTQGLTCGAFLIIDIDDFKQLNDTKGHSFGDAVLLQVAEKLRHNAPKDALIGRFGGDEFILFLPEANSDVSPEDFQETVRALCSAIVTPDQDACYSISLGASLFPTDGETESALMQNADRALYHVKHNGKNSFAFFRPSMPMAFDHQRPVLKKRRRARQPISWERLRPLIFAIVIAVSILTALTNAYLNSLQKMIRNDSLDYLHEIADQINISTLNTLRAYASQIEIIGDDLHMLQPSMDTDALCAFLNGKCADANCEKIAAIDDASIWYTSGHQGKNLPLNGYLADCVLRQITCMSEAVNIDGIDYLVIFVPTDFATSDGRNIRAIAAFLRFDMLYDILSLTAFGGAGHADILTRDGRIVLRAQVDDCILTNRNLFTTFRAYPFTDEGGYDAFYDTFFSGESGSCRVLVRNVEHIIYFSKLGYQDWMLLVSVPANTLEARSQAFIRITLFACLAITLIFYALMASLIMVQARNKARLLKIAYTDHITGVANREKFQLDARRLLAQKDARYTMVYTNVDRFKVINDRLGTDGANGVLTYIARALDDAVSDDEAVGRIDADHFGVLLHTQERDEIARRIRSWNRVISDYVPAREAALSISMSYGVYAIDEPTLSIDLILDRSNLARSTRAQAENSASRIYYYDDELREQLLRDQLISDRMEQALSEGRFLMYLQPQFTADTGKLVSFEALVRWQTDDGLLCPGAFIPALERNGFIIKLDLYMFEQVCKLQRSLLDDGKRILPISFNVSRLHLNTDSLLAPYLTIWEKYSVPPQNLEFEFTESVICDNPETLRRVIDDVHLHGFRCSMDDFGAGHSSLNMLHQTNVDVVKIDKSFLGGGSEPTGRSKAILHAVVSLAKQLGMETVAEGVEHEQQAAFLRSIGCDVIQGFYYAKPMPVQDALVLLEQVQK